ncbi:MAG: hypothetical protein P4L87_14205, partial [Formivibrio sp.]|nr:hypothetical protein [Formivibrio sp.]
KRWPADIQTVYSVCCAKYNALGCLLGMGGLRNDIEKCQEHFFGCANFLHWTMELERGPSTGLAMITTAAWYHAHVEA